MSIKKVHLRYSLDKKSKELDFIKSVSNNDLNIIFDTGEWNNGNRINMKIFPKTKMKIEELYIETACDLKEDSLTYLNGYQTWTDSREFKLSEKIPKLSRLVWPIMSMYGDYAFIKNKNKLSSWTYTYIKNSDEIELIGSLSESSGYTIFQYDSNGVLTIIKDCCGLVIDDEYEAFDIFAVKGEENFCFDKYFEAMKLPKPKVKSCTGWTSWYNYYTNITEDIILDNLKAFKSRNIPIDIFQIDDGYQEYVGDWLRINSKFPRGMKVIADEVKASGYKAGIWLAPFICEKKSEIYKKHPEWVIKKAGFNPGWSGMFYVLDFYNEEFRNYLREVFKTVFEEWNYDMVKLDFLYAAALIEREDKTKGQIMYEAMKFLRELAGDRLILGCGVPLGCSFGLVDYCRIGSDVALKWEDKLLKRLHYRERVSTINSLTSTIGRRHLNNRAFLNDPDVFIVRSKGVELDKNQRYSLLLLNLIFGGLVFTSDNLDEYIEEEMKLYKSIFPIKDKKISKVIEDEILRVYLSIDDNEYLALCNLNSEQVVIKNKDEVYFCREKGYIPKNAVVTLEPYESICLLKTENVDENLLRSSNIFMI